MSRHLFRNAHHACIAGLAGALLFAAKPGTAQAPRAKERRACAVSYEKAQELRAASKLRAARDALMACAKSACGEFVQRECTRWLGQIDVEVPSVVLLAQDDAGRPIVDVEVKMDGEALASRLDGRAVAVDPGMHDFAFRAMAGAVIERRVAIVQGERNRLISVDLQGASKGTSAAKGSTTSVMPRAQVRSSPSLAPVAAAPATTPPPVKLASEAALPPPSEDNGRSGFSSVAPYLVGGVGLLGVGGYALLHGLAKSENGTLSQCWPACSEGRVDRIKNLYLASNISLGVGVAALGTATYLFLASPGREKPPAQSASYVVDVTPSRSGVFASVSGVF